MTEQIRSLLLLSDIHAGSPYAVCDDVGIPIQVGNEVNWVFPNKSQLEMYKKWVYMGSVADKFNVDTVINLADAIDGANYKECGRRLMTSELDAQKDLAVRLLKPIVKDRIYVGCSGSPYHQSQDTKIHKTIADDLRDSAKNVLFVGVAGLLTIPEVNKRLLIAHKASNAMLYTATMLDRELIYQKVAEANKQLPEIHYRITGHLHKCMHLDNGYQHYMQLPCWKTWYPIQGSTKLVGRMQTDIGFTILMFDEAGRSTVKNFVWPSPNIAIKEATI